MARGFRVFLSGYVYHVTHRCHNQTFLLRFARDRDTYRRMLRERLERYPVNLLAYCITCNHIHLLLTVCDGAADSLSRFMQSLEGDFAQAYNLRKKRKGAFWSDRYHAVLIDNGEHLWNCLVYIDLNMVRAGMVEHPREWAWCGYQELTGLRKRYRLIDRKVLLDRLGGNRTISQFQAAYAESTRNHLERKELARQAMWTEGLAVGGKAFVDEVGSRSLHRVQLDYARVPGTRSAWVVRENRTAAYS